MTDSDNTPDLTKWPRLLAPGTPLTPEQANIDRLRAAVAQVERSAR